MKLRFVNESAFHIAAMKSSEATGLSCSNTAFYSFLNQDDHLVIAFVRSARRNLGSRPGSGIWLTLQGTIDRQRKTPLQCMATWPKATKLPGMMEPQLSKSSRDCRVYSTSARSRACEQISATFTGKNFAAQFRRGLDFLPAMSASESQDPA